MGMVLEVEHVRLGKRFALKVLRAGLRGDASLVERFSRELHTLAALQSEYIVNIVDSGHVTDGRPYFVMERLYGEDLCSLLARVGALPVGRAVNIALGVCRALQIVHRAGVVHCDLKPANVFVVRGDDGRDVVKLLDFGVATALESHSTSRGMLVGTVRYMAPEQVRTGGSIGAHTDIFALGAILYECLAGCSPFHADTLERAQFAIMNTDPPALESLRSLPLTLRRAVHRALEKQPEHRYPDVSAFATELSAVLSESCPERDQTPP
jgi:serine/threonine-protein kinase